jgi:hypothetical protein
MSFSIGRGMMRGGRAGGRWRQQLKTRPHKLRGGESPVRRLIVVGDPSFVRGE